MSGWLILLLIGGAAGVSLWLLGVRRQLASLIGAALMLGATGYALQGRPALPGAPAGGSVARSEVEPALIELRWTLWGRFTFEEQYFVAADAMRSAGNRAAAAQVMLGAVRSVPGSAQAWTGLGTALVEHDGALSPAARLAFARARQLAPRHPGPGFYRGMALVETGDLHGARLAWRQALARTQADTEARTAIAARLAVLEYFIAQGR